MKDYYKILELHPEASEEVIQKAYRALARKHHPDQYHSSNKAHSSERMKELNEAYTTLSNPIRRQQYDRKFINQSQGSSRPLFNRKATAENIKNIAFWMALTLCVIGAFSGFARIFFMTPVGRGLLLLVLGFLFFRFTRKRVPAS